MVSATAWLGVARWLWWVGGLRGRLEVASLVARRGGRESRWMVVGVGGCGGRGWGSSLRWWRGVGSVLIVAD